MTEFFIEQGMSLRAANSLAALLIIIGALAVGRVLFEIWSVAVLGMKPSWVRHRIDEERTL